MQDATHVPLVVEHLVKYLEEFGLNHEGLFRTSGSEKKIRALKQKYDQGEKVDLVQEGDVESAAGLLKRFLNQLPVAVFPDNVCAAILACFEGNINHMAECTRCLRTLLCSLPQAHYHLFHYLAIFLGKVSLRSDVNQMTLENLATVFGPTVFRIPCRSLGHEEQRFCNSVLLHTLRRYEELFAGSPESQFLVAEDSPQDEECQRALRYLKHFPFHEKKEKKRRWWWLDLCPAFLSHKESLSGLQTPCKTGGTDREF
ncbi:protein FAM13A-like isoform X2 [Sphaerodactylus townsendi]|nr:protein FAM13A-like isoform X2 [Sphaerodactylus townsendi]XP_048362466.1 protein FAM13A-like isoform X2 [Sphaerodactylus townsendi]